jgi:putative ribosome biogenesis GTPase RsgA
MGCATKITDILNKNFSVTGLVSTGYNTFTLADSAKETIGNLTKKLCFSILGGKSGIGKNNALRRD